MKQTKFFRVFADTIFFTILGVNITLIMTGGFKGIEEIALLLFSIIFITFEWWSDRTIDESIYPTDNYLDVGYTICTMLLLSFTLSKYSNPMLLMAVIASYSLIMIPLFFVIKRRYEYRIREFTGEKQEYCTRMAKLLKVWIINNFGMSAAYFSAYIFLYFTGSYAYSFKMFGFSFHLATIILILIYVISAIHSDYLGEDKIFPESENKKFRGIEL